MTLFIKKPKNSRSLSKRKPVLGVGVNDVDYMIEIRINGKRLVCPAYRAWKHILRRCYCERFLSKNETYRGVSVCNEWLSLSNFTDWYEKNSIPGWQIDKDLLTDSRVYSPETCIYVPRWLNNFTEDHRSARGDFKIGVCRGIGGNGFIAQCSNPNGGSAYIGTFSTEDDAYKAWLKRKLRIAKDLKSHMDLIDERIYPRVIEIIKRLK